MHMISSSFISMPWNFSTAVKQKFRTKKIPTAPPQHDGLAPNHKWWKTTSESESESEAEAENQRENRNQGRPLRHLAIDRIACASCILRIGTASMDLMGRRNCLGMERAFKVRVLVPILLPFQCGGEVGTRSWVIWTVQKGRRQELERKIRCRIVNVKQSDNFKGREELLKVDGRQKKLYLSVIWGCCRGFLTAENNRCYQIHEGRIKDNIENFEGI